MKKTATITELTKGNYKVTTTSNKITVTNTKPFKVIMGQKIAEATKVDDEYVMVIEGLVINDTVPFTVTEHVNPTNKFPLINHLIENADKQSVKPVQKMTFNRLKVGSVFEYEGASYVKLSENSYNRNFKIIKTGADIVVENDFDVASSDQYNVLSPDQVQEILNDLPEGMDTDSLVDHLHDVLDNIPGFEMPDSREEVIEMLVNHYQAKQQ